MIIFFSFMMSTDAVIGVPSKNLGDESKNTDEDYVLCLWLYVFMMIDGKLPWFDNITRI
jgi:hypothetical protein